MGEGLESKSVHVQVSHETNETISPLRLYVSDSMVSMYAKTSTYEEFFQSKFHHQYYFQQNYSKGLDIGAMIPCLTKLRGFVASWNVSFVVHSGPTGKRNERSYCWRVSK